MCWTWISVFFFILSDLFCMLRHLTLAAWVSNSLVSWLPCDERHQWDTEGWEEGREPFLPWATSPLRALAPTRLTRHGSCLCCVAWAPPGPPLLPRQAFHQILVANPGLTDVCLASLPLLNMSNPSHELNSLFHILTSSTKHLLS